MNDVLFAIEIPKTFEVGFWIGLFAGIFIGGISVLTNVE